RDWSTDACSSNLSHTNVAPAIHVVKSASPTSVREGGVGGDQVTYSYQVTNTSPAGASDPLHGVTLGDSDGTPVAVLSGGFNVGDTNHDNILQNTETWQYTLTVTPPAQNAGTSHTNTATASGTDNENNTATATATATITYTDVAPAIHVVKSASPSS